MLFSEKILLFYRSLNISERLPAGVEVMNPYRDPVAFDLCTKFYHKYYGDENERTMILGINPGRFGAGVTGIPFTDPIKLESLCGIANHLQKKPELSADFIYAMINGYGGIAKFYRKFYITAISPLGFTREGKNLNYYDVPALLKTIEPFIINSLRTQIGFGVNRQVAFCLGEGQNFSYLEKFNQVHGFFGRIEPLAHPRFIMQYKRKLVKDYIAQYVKKLSA